MGHSPPLSRHAPRQGGYLAALVELGVARRAQARAKLRGGGATPISSTSGVACMTALGLGAISHLRRGERIRRGELEG